MIGFKKKIIVSLLSLATLVGCSFNTNGNNNSTENETNQNETQVELNEITLSGYKTEFYVDDTFEFGGACVAKYSDGSTKTIDNFEIIEPDMTTLGTKEVRVKFTEDNKTVEASYFINIIKKPAETVYIENFELKNDVIILGLNESKNVEFEILPLDATDKRVTWIIEDTTIAKIDGNVLTGVNPGLTTILGITNDGAFKSKAIIKVKNSADALPSEFSIDERKLTNDVSFNVASKAYSLISVELMSLGYEVFTVSKGKELGLAYVSYDNAYASTIVDEVTYLDAGFISLTPNNKVIFNEPTFEKMYPLDENLLSSNIWFIDSLRINGLKADHFMADSLYVKTKLNGDVLSIETFEKREENYDLSLGSIYDYDIDNYDFVPLDELPSTGYHDYTSLIKPINKDDVLKNYDKMIEAQNVAGFEEKTTMTMFVSYEAFQMLNGTLSQNETLNGILLETIKDIKFDPKTQYLSMLDNGTVVVKDIEKGKSFKDWLVDAIIIGGGTLLAITITISTGGAGSLIGGALFGLVGEYASQAVFEKKKFNEVDYGKVLVSGLMGALAGGIPVANSIGQFAANSIGLAVIESVGSALKSIVGGETDTEKIIKQAAKDALIAVAFYGIRQIIALRSNGEVSPVEIDRKIKEDKLFSKSLTEIDESPTLALRKEIYSSNSLMTTVSTSQYSPARDISNLANNGARDKIVSGSASNLMEKIEEAFQNFFGL